MNMNDIPDGLGHDPELWNDSLYFDDDFEGYEEEYSDDELLEAKENFYKLEQETI